MAQETQTPETMEETIQPLQIKIHFINGEELIIQNALSVQVGNGILSVCNIYGHYVNFVRENVLYYGCVEDLS